MNAVTRVAMFAIAAVTLSAASGCAAPDANDASPSPPASTAPAEPAAPEASATPAAQERTNRECHAEPAQFAVGQPYTPELAEKVRVASGSTVVRALRPGQVVTMEFRFDRVSLHLDDKDTVTMVTCG